MKGYSPTFVKQDTELNTKSNVSFIELGVKQTCPKDCDCETCKSK
jgi:hypothetical protein